MLMFGIAQVSLTDSAASRSTQPRSLSNHFTSTPKTRKAHKILHGRTRPGKKPSKPCLRVPSALQALFTDEELARILCAASVGTSKVTTPRHGPLVNIFHKLGRTTPKLQHGATSLELLPAIVTIMDKMSVL